MSGCDYAAYFREVLYTKEDLAALDALVAELDEYRDGWHCTMEDKAGLDANLLRVEAERDEARQDLKDEQGKSRASWRSAIQAQDRAEAAEARVTELEAALHEALESRALNSQIRARQYLELEAKNKLLREAVLLLNGMVTCGEAHSERSTAAVVAALAALAKEDTNE